jgi:Tol biopolymer transport system component
VKRPGSEPNVTVVDVRTARSRTIYRGGSSPQWSPTGRSIAFTAERPATTGGIYLVRPDGSHLRLLVPFFGYPHFSPDGTKVATAAGGFRGAVFVANADGSHLRQLTHPFDDTSAVGSPDHQKIAFVRSFPLDVRTGTREPGPSTVYVIDGDGTGLHRIALGDSVAWAPDSAQVTFARDGDIYSAPVAGGATTQLTSGSDDDSTPAWSPNGATIAFTRALSGSARDTCLVDSSRPGPPACLPAGGGAPAWSPDGTLISFTVGDPVNAGDRPNRSDPTQRQRPAAHRAGLHRGLGSGQPPARLHRFAARSGRAPCAHECRRHRPGGPPRATHGGGATELVVGRLPLHIGFLSIPDLRL